MKKILISVLIVIFCFTSVSASDTERPKVAVVLSGGGAKGLAHIALLEKLEELGIPIDMVLGTSMGSLIGGLYCSGYSPNDILTAVKETKLTSLFTTIQSNGYRHLEEPFDYSNTQLSLSLEKGIMNIGGFIDDYKILNCFLDFLGNVPDDMDFDDLPVPFRCIGTNVVTGEEKVFESGSVVDAMRASMSIPIVFPPYEIDDELYVDGGLVNNMPIQLAAEMGYDIIIAEDVNGKFSVEKDDYKTISGSSGSLFRVVVNNTINNQKKYATIMLVPDLRGVGILSFNDPESVIERGLTEMSERAQELQQIADMFTEEQKEYKDPDRTGEYFTRFEEREIEYRKPNAELVREKSLHQSRISVGFSFDSFVSGYVGTDRDVLVDSDEYKLDTSFAILPDVKIRLFLKDLWQTRFSLDTRIEIGNNLVIRPEVYFRFNDENANTHVYGLLDVKTELGSFRNSSDRTLKSKSSSNATEYRQDIFAGIKITNERSFNIDIKAGHTFYFLYGPFYNDEIYNRMYSDENAQNWPHFAYESSFYKDSNSTGLDGEGIRLDVLFDGVIYRDNSFKYKAGVGYSHRIRFGKNGHEYNTVWYDFKAFSTRQHWQIADSYIKYGGFDGMPGARFNDYYTEFIMGGLGYQKLITSGLSNKYLIVEGRIAYRSDLSYYGYKHSLYEDIPDFENLTLKPFATLFDNETYYGMGPAVLEYGIGVGLGISNSILGDIVIGAGLNSSLQMSFYLEIK